MNKIKNFFYFLLLFPVLNVYAAAPTLSHAIGQMMIVGFNGTTIDENSLIVQEIKDYHIGGVILADHYNKDGKSYKRNIESPAQLKTLIAKLQYYSKKYTGLPLFIAVNQEGGMITVLKPEKGFPLADDPSEAQLGKTNLKNIFNKTYQRALVLKEFGINVDLAPVADLNVNPENPGIGKLERSFGSNPKKVTQDLKAAIQAYKKAGILCTLKHYPGLGSASANTDFDSADISTSWQVNELLPYKNLIALNHACTFVMTSHAVNRRLDASGVPASFSKKIVTDLLINKLHFKGLIMTDDMDAVAVSKNFSFKEALEKVVLAGNNIIIYDGTQGNGPESDAASLFKTLSELAKNNPEIKQKILRSYAKILAVKKTIHH